jgi:hypothetical protein
MDFKSTIGLPAREEKLDIDADTKEMDGKSLSDFRVPDDFLCSLLFHNGSVNSA